MIWQGEGLIVNIQKYSEHNLIISLFTQERGILKAMVRGGQSAKRKAVFQLGNLISGTWKTRLESQLGSFSAENSICNYNAKFINQKSKILALKAIIELIYIATREGEAYERLYNITLSFLNNLTTKAFILNNYITYELSFLAEIGYGLNLSECAVTGKKENLYYISPKTGMAVTKEIGQKYHDKLIILPNFIKNKGENITNIKEAFNLTGFFIEKHLLIANYLKMPFSRTQLEQSLS